MKHMLLVSQQTQKNLTDQKRYYNERNPAGGYDIEEDRYRGNQVRNSSESFGGREESDPYSRNQSQYGGDSEIRSR